MEPQLLLAVWDNAKDVLHRIILGLDIQIARRNDDEKLVGTCSLLNETLHLNGGLTTFTTGETLCFMSALVCSVVARRKGSKR